jgi:hypothetical protein
MFAAFYGVDFSGARLAGLNTWIARIEAAKRNSKIPVFKLRYLERLGGVCGADEREVALPGLVSLIAESELALWALDFPFGFPVEVMRSGAKWDDQFDFLLKWGEDGYGAGAECVRRSQRLAGVKHIRRLTDSEERAPFDPYHYRIIYQTFFGMRDVLGPLRRRRRTAILPFHYRRLAKASRVLVEACPASTLKRLGLPHQNYKQPEGGRLEPRRLRARRAILAGLARHVEIGDAHRRVMMRNGGGDAIDAVIAALGGALAWRAADHRRIARHARYPREGKLYV